MKRRNLTPKQNAENIQYNTGYGLRHASLREASPVDEFYQDKITDASGVESVGFVDPIIMLFNQQRLENLGQMGATEFLNSFAQKSTVLDELRSKCSDEDLMKLIKSRHLQSPAEILAWCRYMKENVDSFNKEVQNLLEHEQLKQEQVNQDSIVHPKSE